MYVRSIVHLSVQQRKHSMAADEAVDMAGVCARKRAIDYEYKL
jgi:hypothetical protein